MTPAGGTDGWNTNKLDVADIATKRPQSAGLARGRDTGKRSLDYSDVERSTSSQNARRHLNFTHRNTSDALRTDDIAGARPMHRSPSPDRERHASDADGGGYHHYDRDPLSPRYFIDTASMVGTVVKRRGLAVAMEYGGFEKRSAFKRAAALAAEREREAAARPPSSLQTDVARPPEHPHALAVAKARWARDGLDPRPIDKEATDAASCDNAVADAAGGGRTGSSLQHVAPGAHRPTYTTFAKEASGGRGTNPADPTYAEPGSRNRPVPPQKRRPLSASHAGGGANMKNSAAVGPPPAAVGRAPALMAPRDALAARRQEAQRQADAALVRSLPDFR